MLGSEGGEGNVKLTGCKFPFPTLTVAACKFPFPTLTVAACKFPLKVIQGNSFGLASQCIRKFK